MFVTQNYYSDTLVGQTFEWMIRNAPRVARVCYRETITVETSLGIREAAVTGPSHNWFGDRVSRRLLCPVSYVSRYLSMCFALSYHCHSILYHIVHKLPCVIWVTLSLCFVQPSYQCRSNCDVTLSVRYVLISH